MSLSSLEGHFATSASDQYQRNFKTAINKLNTLNVTEHSSEYKVELGKKKKKRTAKKKFLTNCPKSI